MKEHVKFGHQDRCEFNQRFLLIADGSLWRLRLCEVYLHDDLVAEAVSHLAKVGP
ncbi:MAG: hypothetical protein N2595_01360 [bacterium]|nr:hypothetical protein [bacterium]